MRTGRVNLQWAGFRPAKGQLFVEASVISNLRIQQGRMLAVLAIVFMPALIAVVGFDKGYSVSVIGGGLLIWTLGTAGWLGFSWRWLKPGSTSA